MTDKFHIYRSKCPRERSGDFGSLEGAREVERSKVSSLPPAPEEPRRVVEMPRRANGVTKKDRPPRASNA